MRVRGKRRTVGPGRLRNDGRRVYVLKYNFKWDVTKTVYLAVKDSYNLQFSYLFTTKHLVPYSTIATCNLLCFEVLNLKLNFDCHFGRHIASVGLDTQGHDYFLDFTHLTQSIAGSTQEAWSLCVDPANQYSLTIDKHAMCVQ